MKKSSIVLVGLMMMLTINGCGKAKQEETVLAVESEVGTTQDSESTSKETKVSTNEVSSGNSNGSKEQPDTEANEGKQEQVGWEACIGDSYEPIKYEPEKQNLVCYLQVSNVEGNRVTFKVNIDHFTMPGDVEYENSDTSLGVVSGTIGDDNKVSFEFIDNQGNKGVGSMEMLEIEQNPAPNIHLKTMITEKGGNAEISKDVDIVLKMWDESNLPQ